MAEPINTNPATRANAERSVDTSRLGDDDDLTEENGTNLGLGYRTPATSSTATTGERFGDVTGDVVEEPASQILSDPTVYDVRVISAGSTASAASGTVGASTVVSPSDVEDTQEMPVVSTATTDVAPYSPSLSGTTTAFGTPGTPTTIDGDDEVEATRARIEETRAHLADTVDAIKDKLSPAHIAEEAKYAAKAAVAEKVEDVKHAVSDKVDDVKQAVSGAAGSVAATVGGVAATVTEKAKEVVSGASVAASAAVAQVNELAHTAAEKVQDVLHGAKPKAQERLSSAQERVRSVSYQASTLAQNAGQTAKGAGNTVVDTIRLNPLPAALIGVGVGWLLLSMRKQNSLSGQYEARLPRRDLLPDVDTGTGYDTYSPYSATSGSTNLSGTESLYAAAPSAGPSVGERVSNTLHSAGDKASDLASTAKGKASDLADTAKAKVSDIADTTREKASDVAQSARDIAESARSKASELAGSARETVSGVATGAKDKGQQAVSSLDSFVHENPIAAGAIALLVGTAVGLLIPATSKENELLGPTRDRLADQAQQAASDMAQKARTVAEAAIGTAKESLTEVKDTVKQQFEEVKDTVKQQFDEAKDAVKETAQNEAKAQGLPTSIGGQA